MRAPAERAFAAVGAAGGLTLLVAPAAVLEAIGVDPDLPHIRGAVRLLGARHLAQGTALALMPERLSPAVAVVDAIHAASMVALAAVAPTYRRAALLSAAVAVGSGVVTVRAARAAG
ncbi:hypothetical protein IC607_04215 [Cellulomonas sp. JH27-2]|uniref:hypothetical protein n=1 Tax=Cellulomonas sp. JH27-2 TaxID=2774139 RepID=UPI00177B7134|nr:hypothetical protein [Cellulomonas sp. JH27-2]MBD8058172.1 hypothetical protein [Cellulomonas sp. JH27-2]